MELKKKAGYRSNTIQLYLYVQLLKIIFGIFFMQHIFNSFNDFK